MYYAMPNSVQVNVTFYSEDLARPETIRQKFISFLHSYEYPDYFAQNGSSTNKVIFPSTIDNCLAFICMQCTAYGEGYPIVYNEPENPRSVERRAEQVLAITTRIEALLLACSGTTEGVTQVGDHIISALDVTGLELSIVIYEFHNTGEIIVITGQPEYSENHTYYIASNQEMTLNYILSFFRIKESSLIERNIVFLPEQY